jgi:hypothetical protein
MVLLRARAPRPLPSPHGEEILADYVAAEDALRAFTDRNFGRMCAICARWTLFAARVNEQCASGEPAGEVGAGAEGAPAGSSAGGRVRWRLQSWVTNCCNANHAIESMSEASLAGIVASREEGRQWWLKVKQSAGAPCAALTDQGCALKRGRPELCNRYFCEAVRDYLWALGGEQDGPRLAARLDELQRRWARLYATYQQVVLGLPARVLASQPAPHGEMGSARTLPRIAVRARQRLRREAGWDEFFCFLAAFDRELARFARPVSVDEMTRRFFKVNGDRSLYEPFFARELAAIGGQIRQPETAPEART